MRIVSLVPSLTLTVCDLGLRDSLVGCTNFCVRPRGLGDITRVGGTKDPNLSSVRELEPTHILANEEENTPAIIRECRSICSVSTSFPKRCEDSIALVSEMGMQLGVPDRGEALAREARSQLNILSNTPKKPPEPYLYLIWKGPYMAAGPDTYAASVLDRLGWVNACRVGEQRYPEVTMKDFGESSLRHLILTSEPYPFRMRDADEIKREIGREDLRIWKVDGQLVTWWGSLCAELFQQMTDFLEGREQNLIRELT